MSCQKHTKALQTATEHYTIRKLKDRRDAQTKNALVSCIWMKS